MIVVFFSNYLTHHQIPFCEAMRNIEGVEFYFVSTESMDQERLNGGWKLTSEYPYEIKAYASDNSRDKALELAEQSDVMMIGSAPEIYVEKRMKAGKGLTFRYSERIYKAGRWRVFSPRGAIIRFNTYFRYIRKPLYMLCASSYTASDLAMLGSYIGRCYKWGYFPRTVRFDDFDAMMSNKQPHSILWVARMIELKHPEKAISLARLLRDEKIDFHLTMVGDGPMYSYIAKLIKEDHLENEITLTGSVPAEDVRCMMEKHSIFIATSDQNEGWGAVINEAMNSGCAVVASSAMGASDYLIQNGKNGYAYANGKTNHKELVEYVKMLLSDDAQRKRIGYNAYRTIIDEWNAENAAKKFVHICNGLLNGKKEFCENGVCSKAKIFGRKK